MAIDFATSRHSGERNGGGGGFGGHSGENHSFNVSCAKVGTNVRILVEYFSSKSL